MGDNMKLLKGFGWTALDIVIFTLIIFGAWNLAMVWIVPSFDHMPITVALGLSLIWTTVWNIVNYSIKKYGKSKALDSEIIMELQAQFSNELRVVKTNLAITQAILIEKKLFTLEELIQCHEDYDKANNPN